MSLFPKIWIAKDSVDVDSVNSHSPTTTTTTRDNNTNDSLWKFDVESVHTWYSTISPEKIKFSCLPTYDSNSNQVDINSVRLL